MTDSVLAGSDLSATFIPECPCPMQNCGGTMVRRRAILDPAAEIPERYWAGGAIPMSHLFGLVQFVKGNLMVCPRCRTVMHVETIDWMSEWRAAIRVISRLSREGTVGTSQLQSMMEEEKRRR